MPMVQVCTGTTGHAEAVKFEYDPEKLEYADMVSAVLSLMCLYREVLQCMSI
jgi:peptide methionine sulfoxide reductase MsrA